MTIREFGHRTGGGLGRSTASFAFAASSTAFSTFFTGGRTVLSGSGQRHQETDSHGRGYRRHHH